MGPGLRRGDIFLLLLLSLRLDAADRGAGFDVGAFGGEDLQQRAGAGRLDVGGGLLGFDRVERVADLEAVAGLAVPLRQGRLLHVHADARQLQGHLHASTSRTARSTACLSGITAFSSTGEYGIATSATVTRRIGAFSAWKARSAMTAAM